jgi:hypothetical protein
MEYYFQVRSRNRECGNRAILLKNSKHNQVLHCYGSNIALVADGQRCSGSHALVVRVHGPVILNAVWRAAWPGPGVVVILPIWPIACVLAPIAQCRLGAVMCHLDGHSFPGRKRQDITVFWGSFVAASIGLESPLLLGKIVERIDSSIRVIIIHGCDIPTQTVHSFRPSYGVAVCRGGHQGYKNRSLNEHFRKIVSQMRNEWNG